MICQKKNDNFTTAWNSDECAEWFLLGTHTLNSSQIGPALTYLPEIEYGFYVLLNPGGDALWLLHLYAFHVEGLCSYNLLNSTGEKNNI